MRASGGSTNVFRIAFLYRLGHGIWGGADIGPLRSICLAVVGRLQKWLVFYPFHVDFPFSCHIGHGLSLPHPINIVLNGNSRLGANCKVLHGVTLGLTERPGEFDAPHVGNGVVLGAGATLIGGIRVGDNSLVANSTVTKDVPADVRVVGINRILDEH
jgi:serine acetyltransferase